MTWYDWILPSISTSALFGVALWLFRSVILTRLTKSVQHEFDQRIERVRAELAQRLKINNFRYEKEFSVLVELSDAVFKYREVAKDIVKIIDDIRGRRLIGDKNKSEFETKYMDSYEHLRAISEKFRPFYPDGVYSLVLEFNEVAKSCAANATCAAEKSHREFEFRENAEADVAKLLEISEKIVVAIRRRIVSWEELPVK